MQPVTQIPYHVGPITPSFTNQYSDPLALRASDDEMTVPELSTLSKKINQTRITYPEHEYGVRIEGAPFICEFESPVRPELVCDTLCTVEEPWELFGVKTQIGDEYWKVKGNLFHVMNEHLVGVSPFTVEIAPEWVRMYVKEGCCEDRAAEFVKNLDQEYGLEEVVFSEAIVEGQSDGE